MRLPLIFAVLLSLLVYSAGGGATPRDSGLGIRVEDNGWGGANTDEIKAVLHSVADVLMPQLPSRLLTSIVVSHTDSNPIALYDRGPDGEYQIRLHASAASWHLYVYEFAHELCHVMSNYQENVTAATSKHNQWFEETLCETASLFALKELAIRWAASPPAPEWGPRAERLQRFFDMLISEEHRHLPADQPLAMWLRENEEQLRSDPYQRDKNDLMAKLLLPLFEQQPGTWDALCYLNLDPSDASSSLEHYLLHWYRNAPIEHQPFVASVLGLFRAQNAAGIVDKADAALAVKAIPAGSAGPEKRAIF